MGQGPTLTLPKMGRGQTGSLSRIALTLAQDLPPPHFGFEGTEIAPAISPELTGVQLEVRATLVAALLEGLSVFAGPGRCQAGTHGAIGAELRSAVLRLVRS